MNELFAVVDRNDNIVGYKTRKECHSDKSLTHRSVSIVLFNNEGRVLLQKRSVTKDKWPGYYTVSVSGHVTRGHTTEETAHREMSEEIGIKTDLTFKAKFYIEEPTESEIVSVFTGTHEGPFKPNPDEVEYVRFYSTEEMNLLKNTMTSSAVKALGVLGVLT